jgi:hypothetical protein
MFGSQPQLGPPPLLGNKNNRCAVALCLRMCNTAHDSCSNAAAPLTYAALLYTIGCCFCVRVRKGTHVHKGLTSVLCRA